MHGMIISGPSGSGKTTLGKYVADQMGIAFLDIDEYIWRQDTEIPYTVMYSKEEKIKNLMEAVQITKEFVMAGSMNSFHEYFDHLFLLAVYLTANAETRVNRVHEREQGKFGERILPGGDMYDTHQQFLDDVANYDYDVASCNSSQHTLWLNQMICPILRLDGGDSLEKNAKIIINEYQALQSGGNRSC